MDEVEKDKDVVYVSLLLDYQAALLPYHIEIAG